MKKIVTLALVALCTAAIAQDVPPAPAPQKIEHKGRKAEQRAERLAAGYVSRRISDGGFVRFFDLRKAPADFSKELTAMQKYCGVAIDSKIVAKPADTCAVKFGFEALKDKDVAVAIVISNEGEAPTIVACPEDKVVVLNVDKLSKDLPAENAEEVLNQRFNKELQRCLAFAVAGYATDFACVMKPVAKPADLDTNVGPEMCPPVAGKISSAAKQFGIAEMQTVLYGVAVKQGWAHAPTNEFQKVIWDKVKAAEAKKAVEAEAAKAPAAAPAPEVPAAK